MIGNTNSVQTPGQAARHKFRQIAFGVAKVQDRPGRWQVYMGVWGSPDLDRRIGPVFDRQWKAVEQARIFQHRRTENFRRHWGGTAKERAIY